MADTTGKSQKGAKDAAETTTPAESQAVEKAVQDASKDAAEAKTYSEAEYNELKDALEDKDGRITELEGALEGANEVIRSLSAKESAPAAREKAVVVAVKDGIEREFPLLAWKNMPKDKGGWKQKVEAPKEAK